MRKSFPAPKGLGSRSYASRYADGRNGRSSREKDISKSRVKFLGTDKPLDACLRKTKLKTDEGFSGIFFLILSLPMLLVIFYVIFGN
jgi:hypothetical protein